MSKKNNWVPIDKGLIKALPDDRSFTVLEAMFSHTYNIDCNKQYTINGYAKRWQWSRNKVRNFLNSLGTGKGHLMDKKGTGKGHPIHFIDKGLWGVMDKKGTGKGQVVDNKRDTISNPNPNPNPKEKTFSSDSYEYRLSKLLFDEIKKRNEKHKTPNIQSWAKNIDRMIRLDSREPKDIQKVIIWCQQDSFWQNNILSTAKLREKFDQLVLKMKSNFGNNKKEEPRLKREKPKRELISFEESLKRLNEQ